MPRNRIPIWAWIWTGYSAFGYQFGALGVPPLYVGEAFLGIGILANWRNWVGRFINDSLNLRFLPLAIGLHLGWGLIELVRSCMIGDPLIDGVRNVAFNYYPLYVLLGVALGSKLTVSTFLKSVKFCFIVFAVHEVIEPGMWVADCSLMPLLMISLWDELRDWKLRIPVLLPCLYAVFFAGGHNRGTLIGFTAGMIALAATSRKRLANWCLIGAGATVILLVIGPMIPGPSGGGPPLDPMVQVARVISSSYPDFAARLIKWRQGGFVSGAYRDEIDNQMGARGTASWREEIWRRSLKSLNTSSLKLIGHGPGASMAKMIPDGQDIRTPHNISIYALYYTGYVGLALFFLLITSLWRAGTRLDALSLRSAYSSCFWCTLLVAITGNLLETPSGAVPFYLFQGVIIGLDQKLKAEARQARRHVESRFEELIPVES